MRIAESLSFVALVGALVGCGGSAPPKSAVAPAPAPAAAAAAPTTTAAAAPGKTTSLRRSEIKRTIARGMGAFLGNVSLEDWPVMRDGKFYGFRLRAINSAWNVDLRPGDVVTRVNGMPIEQPEQADAALRSLEKAPSLRVDYERDGKLQTLELPIVDD